MHKGAFQDWEECHDMMVLWFEPLAHLCIKTFLGPGDLREHLSAWMEEWGEKTIEEWVHLFIHALGPIPTAWYLDAELHQCTDHWDTLKDEFVGTFGLIGGTEVLDETLQDIDALVFDESRPCIAHGASTWETQMQNILNCCNLSIEECDEDP